MILVGVVALAAIGSVVRWQAGNLLNASFPVGTLLVNLLGAFALGALSGASPDTLTVVGTGLLGSLTTFSTVMLETIDPTKQRNQSAVYLGVTVVAGIGAAWCGLQLA